MNEIEELPQNIRDLINNTSVEMAVEDVMRVYREQGEQMLIIHMQNVERLFNQRVPQVKPLKPTDKIIQTNDPTEKRLKRMRPWINKMFPSHDMNPTF